MVRAVLALALVATACSGSEGTAAHRPLPTHHVGKTARLAAAEGTLRGSVADECLWVDTNGHRMDVSWPNGYTMSIDPVAVRNRRGRIVVHVGERVSMSGGYGPHATTTRCSTGDDVFMADAVSAAP